MQVIHIVPAISNEASGPSYSVVRLCDSLIANGHDVILAALDWSPIPSPPLFLKTFPLGWGLRRLGRSPAMKQWLDIRVASGNVDLIHNHGMWQMNSVYAGWAAKREKLNYVVSPRGAFSLWAMRSGSIFKRAFWPLLQAPALTAATCFHATAESEYEDIRRLGFRQPIAVIPNGIDIPVLLPKVDTNYRTLLFLGRVHKQKGLDMLLHAWRVVQDRFPEWRLRVVGPDNCGYLGELQQLARTLNLHRVEFSGPLSGVQKWQAYRDADLFVLPSYSENFGIAVAEALASGTPAIVTRGAPWAGLGRHQAGWWIDIGTEPLKFALEEALANSPDRLAEMGQHGKRWMETDFSWAHIGMQMANTYRWLLDRSLPLPACVRLI